LYVVSVVLSGRGLCDGLITCPEESYRIWRVVVCDQETSNSRRLKHPTWLWKIQTQWVVAPGKRTTANKYTTQIEVIKQRGCRINQGLIKIIRVIARTSHIEPTRRSEMPKNVYCNTPRKVSTLEA